MLTQLNSRWKQSTTNSARLVVGGIVDNLRVVGCLYTFHANNYKQIIIFIVCVTASIHPCDKMHLMCDGGHLLMSLNMCDGGHSLMGSDISCVISDFYICDNVCFHV